MLDDALVVLLASFDPYWALVNGSAKRRKIIAAIIVVVKGMLIFLRFQKYNGYRTMGTLLYLTLPLHRGVTILFQIVNDLDMHRYQWHSHGAI